ncbi:hypothetical protein [Enterobacter hormaechei]|uniref:hypothetical protein n=2 Tax=Enterobacter hormaechei TaxID=158836 RepID=UPI0013FD2C65|nr:hypothetical protein [Enterobacter hormaechei]
MSYDNEFNINKLVVIFCSYYRHHLRKSITYRQKPKGLYLSLSSLITLGKRLSVVSAQGLYNVLAGSYQAQARTALEILPSLEAERVAGLSKHIT